MAFIHVDLAAPRFIVDRDAGDEHKYPPLSALHRCPSCNAPRPPEPTPAERARILNEPDFYWWPPPGLYLEGGFGLYGGGYGPYVECDRCGFFLKEQVADGDD